MPSPMGSPGAGLVVAYGAIAGHFFLDVTIDAPAHREGLHLVHLRHCRHVAMTQNAGVATERFVGTEGFDVSHVGEVNEGGEVVNPDPLGRVLVSPRVSHLLDLRLMGWRRPADHHVTPITRLDRWNPRLARYGRRVVTIHARDLVLTGVNIMAEENGLARTL